MRSLKRFLRLDLGDNLEDLAAKVAFKDLITSILVEDGAGALEEWMPREYFAKKLNENESAVQFDYDDGSPVRTIAGLTLPTHKAELVAQALNEAYRAGAAEGKEVGPAEFSDEDDYGL